MITSINMSLLPIVGDDSNFANAAPLLFGTEFAKKGKEMVDQVKAMRSTVSRKPNRRPPFFRGGPPSNRRTSPRGTLEEAEPKTSTTGFGHIKEERPNPSTEAQELRTKCSCVCDERKL